MPKFAANLSLMFTEWGFIDRFAAAAEAGFRAVEFQFPYAFKPDDIARQLSANHLTLALFNLPPGDLEAGERGLAALPGREGAFRASVALALTYAGATGAERLHVMSGVADSADPEARATYADSLRFAVDQIGARDIDVLIEPVNPRDTPRYFLRDFDFAVNLIGDLGTPRLKLLYDIYHRQVLRGDVSTSLEALLPIIGHVQVASAPARNEPGTGELNDDFLFRRLDALGYEGFVGCEYRPANSTLAGLGWWDAWRRRMESGRGLKSMRGDMRNDGQGDN
jgi:hydroxypyruvate isomerase